MQLEVVEKRIDAVRAGHSLQAFEVQPPPKTIVPVGAAWGPLNFDGHTSDAQGAWSLWRFGSPQVLDLSIDDTLKYY